MDGRWHDPLRVIYQYRIVLFVEVNECLGKPKEKESRMVDRTGSQGGSEETHNGWVDDMETERSKTVCSQWMDTGDVKNGAVEVARV